MSGVAAKTKLTDSEREELRAERAIAAPFRGRFETRIVATFVAFAVLWTTVLVLGIIGAIPLWLGLILNTFIASTFYMPLHEATHGNIWGATDTWRRGEDVIGVLSSIPAGICYGAHRSSHMRHHAHTNNPDKDPDHYTQGKLSALPLKWLSLVLAQLILPLFAVAPVLTRVLPATVRHSLLEVDGGGKKAQLQTLRYWALSHGALVAAFLLGFGWPVLLLWYVPARLQALWLLFVFAWYPHHPANEVGRYVDTRTAVFPGSTLLIRGHDYHSLHHLFPRVPHYRLEALWQEMGEDLAAKGVRTQGKALGATGPVVW